MFNHIYYNWTRTIGFSSPSNILATEFQLYPQQEWYVPYTITDCSLENHTGTGEE